MNKIQGLLNWCKYHTDGYSNVSVKNFTSSWKDGMAFNALVHRFKPELIDFHRMDPENEYYNNYIAFKLAETHFGIPSLLDPKDISSCPEKLSIITYVSQFYNCLKDMEPNGGPDINKFENSNNDNADVEMISSRSSVNELAKAKCKICRNKVYLLERYVAEDKLYHRKCYRDLQIQTIENDSEVIGDYLNIYGEWKPTMNENIYIHPFHGIDSDLHIQPIVTYPAVDFTEQYFSDTSDPSVNSEEVSESLSSYSSNISELCANNDFNIPHDDDSSIKVSDPTIEQPNEDDQTTSCQENLVLNMIKSSSLKPIKTRLYIKKRDKELPYSTFFEISSNPKLRLNLLDYKNEEISCSCKPSNIDNLSRNEEILDIKKSQTMPMVLPDEKRKLIEITPGDDVESDLSSVEEERYETVLPSIVRNSIWRTPIISTSIRKYHSASEPIETKYECYSEFKEKLANLNFKQSSIEAKGRKIQQKLWEEDPTTQEYEDLLTVWLELVEEKDKIFYEENALYAWLKDLKLQEMKEKLECQIRLLSQDNNPSESAIKMETELVSQLIEIVNKRSELFDSQHTENVKRLETMKLRNATLEKHGILKENKEEILDSNKQNEIGKKKRKLWNRKGSQI